jgi:lipid-A-disaccharide synthase
MVSAGESSGDLYAAELVGALRAGPFPTARFFGCAGPRMRQAGVEAVIEAESLSVVGLVEVMAHLPRIWGQYRRLLASAGAVRPDLAILTDSPDFHLRAARNLHRQGIPVLYLVAPQVWAWRKGRLPAMRRDIDRLLCIFPFEPEFFAAHAIHADYIGHPLTRLVRPAFSRQEFFSRHNLDPSLPLLTVLPGSRVGEAGRHLGVALSAVELAGRQRPVQTVVALPQGFSKRAGERFFRERGAVPSIKLIEGETWDAIAHANVALAASGTVTVEAALLGTPMVTFYKVTGLSWWMGRRLVNVPYYSMVNLVAGRQVVPELMQDNLTADALCREALELLDSPEKRSEMQAGLREVAERLSSAGDPVQHAAGIAAEMIIDGRRRRTEGNDR